MLAEFAYCPRLCYIEWIGGEFVDNADTVDGSFQHRRVDQDSGRLPEDEFEAAIARSVYLTGEKVGISCRIDLLEGEGRRVTPVEYKRGEAPRIPEGAYEPERVQLCAQGLVLRENGFQSDGGIVYFARSRKRVPVDFDKALVQRTKDLITELKGVAEKGEIPPPLQDSPKCVRCSLAGICLPDEVNLLREMDGRSVGDEGGDRGLMGKIRRLLPARDDSMPVYVVGHGHTVRKKGDRLEIRAIGKVDRGDNGRDDKKDGAKKDGAKKDGAKKDGAKKDGAKKDGAKKDGAKKDGAKKGKGKIDNKVVEARLREISQVNLFGGVEISTPALVDLMQRGIPVLHFIIKKPNFPIHG